MPDSRFLRPGALQHLVLFKSLSKSFKVSHHSPVLLYNQSPRNLIQPKRGPVSSLPLENSCNVPDWLVFRIVAGLSRQTRIGLMGRAKLKRSWLSKLCAGRAVLAAALTSERFRNPPFHFRCVLVPDCCCCCDQPDRSGVTGSVQVAAGCVPDAAVERSARKLCADRVFLLFAGGAWLEA